MLGNIISGSANGSTSPMGGKLTISAYGDLTFGALLGSFSTPINPNSFSESLKISYNKEQPQGSQGNELRYSATPPEGLELEFVLDGTGVVGTAIDVRAQVLHLKQTIYNMLGDTHRPKYVIVVWGSFSFKGVTEDLKISYTLFKPDGTPLRAKINIKFLSAIALKERLSIEGKNSSDLTHKRVVQQGDTLPLMTHKIYNDSSLYLKVAKFNKLSNFRNLVAGTQLVFPPQKVLDELG